MDSEAESLRGRVRLNGPGPTGADKDTVERLLCNRLRLSLSKVRVLLAEFPTVLPKEHPIAEAAKLAEELTAHGLNSVSFSIPEGELSHCAIHRQLLESSHCSDCNAALCLPCERSGGGRCENCVQKSAKKQRHQRVRVGVLLVILCVVLFFGAKELRRRNLGWERPQRVAVVLLQRKGTPVGEALAQSFAARTDAIEAVLKQQRQRYAPSASAPVELTVFGPVPEQAPLPELGEPGLIELLLFNLRLSHYADANDALAKVPAAQFDVRIYVRAAQSDGTREVVEGLGQLQGKVGVVTTEFSEGGVDFAWFVVLHEYLHTRGATDKYNALGLALRPQGLATPDLQPLFPQQGTEMMARGRPLSPHKEDIPGEPESWVVGYWTAAEIGWVEPQKAGPDWMESRQ